MNALMQKLPRSLEQICMEQIVPAIEADGGRFYVVSYDTNVIHIHLAGACSGCPGAKFTEEDLIRRMLQSFDKQLNVNVTVGWIIPEGATQLKGVAAHG